MPRITGALVSAWWINLKSKNVKVWEPVSYTSKINYLVLTLVADDVEERRFLLAGGFSLAVQPPFCTQDLLVEASDISRSSSEREYDISDSNVPGNE